jgi:hypothetical protein
MPNEDSSVVIVGGDKAGVFSSEALFKGKTERN